MERTFFPNRSYWIALGAIIGLLLVGVIVVFAIGMIVDDRSLHEKTAELLEPPALFFLTLNFACLLAAIFYGVAAHFRQRLVIGTNEIRYHGAFLVRTIRFADVVEAQWSFRDLRLRNATRELVIWFDQFANRGTQDELLDLLRGRLRPSVRQNWEEFQAVREGRASAWSPPIFTFRSMLRMGVVVTVFAAISGAALGLLSQIRFPNTAEWWARAAGSGEIRSVINIPGAAKWPWSGWLILDWSLLSTLLSLIVGISFLLFLCFLEWALRKWTTIQARRLERAISPPSDSRDG